jgi:hypothetical protein
VHVLEGECAGVGISQDVPDLPERRLARAGEAVRGEPAVEVPDRQAEVRGVELGVRRRWHGRERIDVGDQVPPGPVVVDEAQHASLLVRQGRRICGRPLLRRQVDRTVRHVDRVEDATVEVVVSEEQRVHAPEELSALGALDHPMVVRARERDDLRDPELSDRLEVGALVLGGIGDSTDPDDRRLPRHQPRDRLHRPEHTGVRDRQRRASQVVGL